MHVQSLTEAVTKNGASVCEGEKIAFLKTCEFERLFLTKKSPETMHASLPPCITKRRLQWRAGVRKVAA